MSNTKTSSLTIQGALDNAVPTVFEAALNMLDLGTMLTNTEYDTGTVSASATVVLPYEAAFVQSARVVTSGTAGSLGSYVVADSAATPVAPPSASTQPGVASIATDRKTITFPNTVTRVVVRYLPMCANPSIGRSVTGIGASYVATTKSS